MNEDRELNTDKAQETETDELELEELDEVAGAGWIDIKSHT